MQLVPFALLGSLSEANHYSLNKDFKKASIFLWLLKVTEKLLQLSYQSGTWNPRSPDFKSGALTRRPRCLPYWCFFCLNWQLWHSNAMSVQTYRVPQAKVNAMMRRSRASLVNRSWTDVWPPREQWPSLTLDLSTSSWKIAPVASFVARTVHTTVSKINVKTAMSVWLRSHLVPRHWSLAVARNSVAFRHWVIQVPFSVRVQSGDQVPGQEHCARILVWVLGEKLCSQ